MPTTPHSAKDGRRQANIPHSGCDRSPIRQLRSLLRHPGRCGSTMELVTRDETCSAQLPLLFYQLRLSGLHLTTRMAPSRPPAREGVRRRHVHLKEGRSALAAGGPNLPPRGVRDLHVTLRPPWCTCQHSVQGGPGPPRAPLPLAHIYVQDPVLQGPQNAATPNLEDCTPYSDDHAAYWGLAGCRRDLRKT